MKPSVLHIDKVLEYYDGPQLFVARDEFDTMFLCLAFDDDRFTAIRISANRLKGFEHGEEDLLSLFLKPESEGEYFDVHKTHDNTLAFSKLDEVQSDRLPSEGYYLSSKPYEKITISIPSEDKGLFASIVHRFGWIAM